LTAKRLLPLTGILAVALVFVGFAVAGEAPDVDAPIKEVTSFYTENDSDQELGALLLGLGAFAFLVFASVLRNALRRAEGDGAGASTLSFAGAILFAVGMAIFSGLGFTLGESAKDIDPVGTQALHALSVHFFTPLALGMIAFLIGSGVAVVRSGALPAWLGWAAVIVGVLGFTPLWFVPFIGIALFILISSVMLAMRAEA
jgi:hypothetical protein